MAGTRNQNSALKIAYGVVAGSYFENLIDQRFAYWGRSSKFMDLQTRPYPRLWSNQQDFISSGWERTDVTECLGLYFDVVLGMNAGPAGMYNEGTTNINALIEAREDTEAYFSSARYDEINAAKLTYHTKPVYHCPYHRLDSVEGNSTAAWAWCQANDGWLLNNNNQIMGYVSNFTNTTTRRLTQWDKPTWQAYWANTAKTLCITNNFDGVFADNAYIGGGAWATNFTLGSDGDLLCKNYQRTGTINGYNLSVAMNNMINLMLSSSYCGPDQIVLANSLPVMMRSMLPSNTMTARHYNMDEDWRSDMHDEAQNYMQLDIKMHLDTRSTEPTAEAGCSTARGMNAGYPYGYFYPARLCSGLMTDGIIGVDLDAASSISTLQTNLRKVGKVGYPTEDASRIITNSANSWSGLWKREFTHAVVFANTTSGTNYTINLSDYGLDYRNLRTITGATLTSNSLTIKHSNQSNTNNDAGGIILKKLDVTPPPEPEDVPAAPTSLAVTSWNKGSTGKYWLGVSWTDNATNENGFRMYRSTDGGSTYVLIKDMIANAQSYNIDLGTDVPFGAWKLKLVAYNAIGESTGNIIDYTAVAIGETAPATPTNLAIGTIRKDHTQLKVPITWTDNATNETGYRVYTALDQETNWIEQAELAAGSSSYEINLGSVATAGTYYIKVSAYNSSLETDSTVVSRYINPAGIAEAIAPLAPTNLELTFEKGDSTNQYFVLLRWQDASNDEASFSIGTSNDGVAYTTVGSVQANIDAFEYNLGTSPVGTVYFIVSAVNAAGIADSSAVSASMPPSVYTDRGELTPKIPSNVAATFVRDAVSKEVVFTVTFTDTSTNKTGLYLYMSKDGGSYTKQSTASISTSPFTFRLPASEYGTYSFKMTTYNDYGESQQSDASTAVLVEQQISPPDPELDIPAAPSNLAVERIYRNVEKAVIVLLSWTDNSDNETKFAVYQDGVKVKEVNADTRNTGINLGLVNEDYISYDWYVTASNTNGESSASNTVTSIITQNTEQEVPTVPPTTDPYPIYMSLGSGPIVVIVNTDYINFSGEGASSGSLTLNTTGELEFSGIGQSSGQLAFTLPIECDITAQSSNNVAGIVKYNRQISFEGLAQSSGELEIVRLLDFEGTASSSGELTLSTTGELEFEMLSQSSGNLVVYNEYKVIDMTITVEHVVTGTITIEE